MQLSDHEKEILKLIVLGAFIGLGKVFVGGRALGGSTCTRPYDYRCRAFD